MSPSRRFAIARAREAHRFWLHRALTDPDLEILDSGYVWKDSKYGWEILFDDEDRPLMIRKVTS